MLFISEESIKLKEKSYTKHFIETGGNNNSNMPQIV